MALIGRAISQKLIGIVVAGSAVAVLAGTAGGYWKGRKDGKAIVTAKVESERNAALRGAIKVLQGRYAQAAHDRVQALLRNQLIAHENADKKAEIKYIYVDNYEKVETDERPVLDTLIPADVMLSVNCVRDPGHSPACGPRGAGTGDYNIGEPAGSEGGDFAGSADADGWGVPASGAGTGGYDTGGHGPQLRGRFQFPADGD